MSKTNSLFLLLVTIGFVGACQTSSVGVLEETKGAPLVTVSVPTATHTETPSPTGTFTPTATETLTPTITPTLTETPLNFVLAEEGYDIANVRLTYPSEDILLIEFEYRFENEFDAADLRLIVPDFCDDGEPSSFVIEPVGEASIEFVLRIQGECNLSSFQIEIFPATLGEDGVYYGADVEPYSEVIDIPIALSSNKVEFDNNSIKVSDFEFEATGSWTGEFYLDYELSKEISLEESMFVFSVRGTDDGTFCSFDAYSETITKYSGSVVIPIDLMTDIYDLGNGRCKINTSSYTFITLDIYFLDGLYGGSLYHHNRDFEMRFIE